MGNFARNKKWVLYEKEQTVAILGFSERGQEQAQFFKNKGLRVIIGLREIDDEWEIARKNGYSVFSIIEAIGEADIIQVW